MYSAHDGIHMPPVMSYIVSDVLDTVAVMSGRVTVKLHNGCVVITLCVMPYKVDMS